MRYPRASQRDFRFSGSVTRSRRDARGLRDGDPLRAAQPGRGLRTWAGVRVRRVLLVLAGMGALGGLVLLASAAAELASESRILEVQKVTVRGATYLTDDAVVKQLGKLEGVSLLDVDPARLEARLLAHPRIARAEVRRGFDRRLKVEIAERRPVALLGAGLLVEVDREGIVLPPVAPGALPDLPIVIGATGRPPAPGSRVKSASLRGALALLADLERTDPDLLGSVSQIDVSGSPVYRLSLVGRSAVLVVHAASLTPARLAGVRSVLDDLERRGRRAVEVDLRFEGQLVVRDRKG